ncbi:uncharacterized protein N7515_004236 [Penicillium bovifimosum]|uniref:RING-type domain-containing protein n=1 Tax=Penicillium bovifimosum TaxID=126998 RepID=A0A9W9H6M6_9EURO|nr:uncharacterized protein N7515_004236 [Penicillium bovifimosum]KAJ5139388.1 hypothetical protein N7515_004236 [Penicillium bovifimosum]
MAEHSMPREEIIGVVIGAVVVFSLISVIPMLIMWYHRRRAIRAARNQIAPAVYQVPLQTVMDRWLEEQNIPTNAQRYGQDTCPICLSALSSSPYPCCPDPAVLAHHQQSDLCGAHHPPESKILILNRCKHAFHLACLRSWFEYRRYKCPICQASYSPDEEA